MKIKILLLIVIFTFAWSACEANQVPLSNSAKKQLETKKNRKKTVKFPGRIPVSESAKKKYKERYNPKTKKMVYNPPKKQKKVPLKKVPRKKSPGFEIVKLNNNVILLKAMAGTMEKALKQVAKDYIINNAVPVDITYRGAKRQGLLMFVNPQ